LDFYLPLFLDLGNNGQVHCKYKNIIGSVEVATVEVVGIRLWTLAHGPIQILKLSWPIHT
jgi:hypothetical protein